MQEMAGASTPAATTAPEEAKQAPAATTVVDEKKRLEN